MSGRYDFEVQQGSTFARSITWADQTGTPINLSGFTARMQIRPSYSSAEPVIELISGDGIELGDDGEISIVISAETTADLPAGTDRRGKRYRYDLEMIDLEDRVFRLLEGDFVLRPEVTR